ncbi:MAG: ribulose bisphosphate carboxylase small subunit [Cyanobacteria bacterium LVE1205-1]|jgi:ribulose-bisphosphate carboxylase small chain
MKTLPKEIRFETLSYLPPLSDTQLIKQVDYILQSGFFPCIEFSESADPKIHYWTMWKLPLFNATSSQEVLNEVRACKSEYPNNYIRVVGFDNVKQCQVLSFIVHKPTTSRF